MVLERAELIEAIVNIKKKKKKTENVTIIIKI